MSQNDYGRTVDKYLDDPDDASGEGRVVVRGDDDGVIQDEPHDTGQQELTQKYGLTPLPELHRLNTRCPANLAIVI